MDGTDHTLPGTPTNTALYTVSLEQLNIDNPMQKVINTQELLTQLPKSKYREDNYLSTLMDSCEPTSTDKYNSDATLPYSLSDETIQYWSCGSEQNADNQECDETYIPVHHVTKKKRVNSKVIKFSINVHGIHRHHHKYYFKCVVAKCNETFNKIKDWNIHHRIFHKTKIKCELCGKRFVTLSSHRAHKNFHVPHKYTCHLCKKTFAFQSGLKQHATVHTRLRLHHCFYGSCTKTFKWPQDLTHHVQ